MDAKGLRHFMWTCLKFAFLLFTLGGLFGDVVYQKSAYYVNEAIANWKQETVEVTPVDSLETKPKESRAEYWRRKSLEKTERLKNE